ncbi:DUF7127 family protein [Halomarina litorea]|uniref:DUF7127 family protein n=1 Tax=Halomarina litorea TaxID=2961595 RepID=UPI0020C3BD14|nr:hypothetical protein [Halomarina sp. BCD28]
MDTTQTNDPHVTRHDYGDRWVVAVDLAPLGVEDADVTVDVVGDGAVVAVDTPAVRTQFDLDLPTDEADHSMNNGVLVVEGSR